MRLRAHDIVLRGESIVLRPITEDDWDVLARWNSDPEVLWFSDGDDVESYDLHTVQAIYRGVSQSAFCFIVEVDGAPVGECWLQQLNLDRILRRYPDRDCRRIDLLIGEKELWGRGYGTEVVGLLTCFGFEQEHADLIFGCGIADYNARSLKAFLRNGYAVDAKIELPPGGKAEWEQDVVLSREAYGRTGAPRRSGLAPPGPRQRLSTASGLC